MAELAEHEQVVTFGRSLSVEEIVDGDFPVEFLAPDFYYHQLWT